MLHRSHAGSLYKSTASHARRALHPTASPVMLPVQAILLQLLLESNIFRYFMLLYYTKIRILPAAGSRAAVRHSLDARAMDEAT